MDKFVSCKPRFHTVGCRRFLHQNDPCVNETISSGGLHRRHRPSAAEPQPKAVSLTAPQRRSCPWLWWKIGKAYERKGERRGYRNGKRERWLLNCRGPGSPREESSPFSAFAWCAAFQKCDLVDHQWSDSHAADRWLARAQASFCVNGRLKGIANSWWH